MDIEYHIWYSPSLNQDMELKIYGYSGKPVVVFPSSGGRFYEYEDFGMIHACQSFIDAGKIRIFAIDSIDRQSWLNFNIHPVDRARRHDAYERYIVDELVPFIRQYCSDDTQFMATGCSMGAYHAANFFFRHPDVFDSVIGLSGLYGPNYLLKNYMDEHVYYYFPLAYLPGLHDPWFIDKYRKSRIMLCVGQGAWEKCDDYDCIEDTRRLKEILESKSIPCWVDFWGFDVNHDWVWWKIQMPYFLGMSIGNG
ncbi:MAG: esterase family protein [Desulfobacterales bacterium]|nr:esterase family protein [Desulfobacterales bacterium]